MTKLSKKSLTNYTQFVIIFLEEKMSFGLAKGGVVMLYFLYYIALFCDKYDWLIQPLGGKLCG